MFLVISGPIVSWAPRPPAGAGCGLRNYSTTPRKLSSPTLPAGIGWRSDQRMWVTSAATAGRLEPSAATTLRDASGPQLLPPSTERTALESSVPVKATEAGIGLVRVKPVAGWAPALR